MRCPFCQADDDRVIDSRPNRDNNAIRRRRQCEACGKRFTTYEYVEAFPVQIVKKDGRREDFSREKVLGGLALACRKRSVPHERLERIADEIHEQLARAGAEEVPSTEVGELIMEKLRGIDQIAYVRFASVYREFKDVEEFRRAVEQLISGGARREP